MTLHVVAAVIEDAAGRVLVAKRPEGKPEAGLWEFPGGKVEPGESARAALARELSEELGVSGFSHAEPLICVPVAEAGGGLRLRLRLDAWRVRGITGFLEAREHSALAWCLPKELAARPMPPADRPIAAALHAPESCLITPEPGAGEAAEAAWLQSVEAALASGVRRVQLRVRSASQRRRLAPLLQAACNAAGAELLVNHDAELAQALGLALHLRAADLAQAATGSARSASCHDDAELARAAELGVDFALLGPVLPTESHPGAPTLGWTRFEALRATVPGLTVYALGGLHPQRDAAAARAHGAQGVAGIRGFGWGTAAGRGLTSGS